MIAGICSEHADIDRDYSRKVGARERGKCALYLRGGSRRAIRDGVGNIVTRAILLGNP